MSRALARRLERLEQQRRRSRGGKRRRLPLVDRILTREEWMAKCCPDQWKEEQRMKGEQRMKEEK